MSLVCWYAARCPLRPAHHGPAAKGWGMRNSLITIALAIGLLAGSASTVSATTTATAPKLPALYNLEGAQYAASASRKAPVAPELVSKGGRYRIVWGVRPAGRFTIYSGPGVYLLGTRWASWTAATARATGELWGVDAKLVDLGHVSIVLSAPKSHDGLVYYSALRIVGGGAVVHYWLWHWSGPEIGWTPAG